MIANIPIFFFHTISDFANLPYTFYLVSGVLWGLKGIQSGKVPEQTISDLLLGLAAWTRPEGIGFSIIVLFVFLISRVINNGNRIHVSAIIFPISLFAIPWFAFTITSSYMEGINLDQAVSVNSS